MSAKGELTRRNIIEKSLQLFSVKGYFHTSISDIQRSTGLTKGGLYCHFGSKEEIWYAVYDLAVKTWRSVVFRNIRTDCNPLQRIQQTLDQVLMDYLGGDVFEGGCFFVNMLVELSGQSAPMTRHILKGFVGFSKLLQAWFDQALAMGLVKTRLDFRQISNFLVITLNGAATLYMSTRDTAVLQHSRDQLRYYLEQLKA